MTHDEAVALSPTRAQVLADGSRPASQSGLADMLRAVDPTMLRDTLAAMADAHGFSWDAYTALGRVGRHLILKMVAK